MGCFSIQVTGGDINWDTLPVYLDVDAETTPSLQNPDIDVYKGQFVDELVYNLSFPFTTKNYRILNSLASGQGISLKPKEVDITAMYNGEVMGQNKMRAVSNKFHSEDGRFHVVLYNVDGFAKKAKALYLRDIDFKGQGDITQIIPEIYARNLQGDTYVDGGSIVRFPWVAVSKNHGSDYAYTADLHLPHVYLWPVLKLGFAQIGIVFKCPFLESPHGRRVLSYLVDDNCNGLFGKQGDIQAGYFDYPTRPRGSTQVKVLEVQKEKVEAINAVPTRDLEGRTYFFTGGFITNPRRGFTTHGVYTLDIKMKVQPLLATSVFTNPFNQPPSDDIFELFVMCGEEEVYKEEILINWGAPSLNNFEINALVSGLCVSELRNLTIRYRCKKAYEVNKNQYKLSLAFFEDSLTITTEKALIPAGATYKVNQIFQSSDTLYDLFIGTAQWLFGKVDIHYSGRVVNLLTPFDVEIKPGEVIEGYYLKMAERLNRIKAKTHEIDIPDTELSRYIGLGWRATSDSHAASLVNVEETSSTDIKKKYKADFYGTYVDFGDPYIPNRDDYINGYFEPTVNISIPIGKSYPVGPTILGFQPSRRVGLVPALIGTEDWKQNDVGRRILYSYGYRDFFRRDEKDGSSTAMYYGITAKGATLLQKMFMAYQHYDDRIHKIPATWQDDRIFDLKYNSTYKPGDGEIMLPNLYTHIARKFLISLRNFNKARVQVYFRSIDYGSINYRKQKMYTVKDHVIAGYMQQITDYTPCTPENPAQVEIIIFDQFTNIPTTKEEYEENGFASPVEVFDFYINKVGCTYNAVPTGTSQI